MLNLRTNKKGFTLLEILIVLVILAVLAGLAIPSYTQAVEKSRAQEALATLAATREACLRFHAVNGTFVGINNGLTTGIDTNPNAAAGSGQQVIFTYAASNQAANTITITATRVASANNPIVGGGGTISIDQGGTVVRGGVYV